MILTIPRLYRITLKIWLGYTTHLNSARENVIPWVVLLVLVMVWTRQPALGNKTKATWSSYCAWHAPDTNGPLKCSPLLQSSHLCVPFPNIPQSLFPAHRRHLQPTFSFPTILTATILKSSPSFQQPWPWSHHTWSDPDLGVIPKRRLSSPDHTRCCLWSHRYLCSSEFWSQGHPAPSISRFQSPHLLLRWTLDQSVLPPMLCSNPVTDNSNPNITLYSPVIVRFWPWWPSHLC